MLKKTAHMCLLTGLLSSLPILSLRSLADEKVALIYRATKGQVVRSRSRVLQLGEYMGQKYQRQIQEVDKTTVTEVGKDGNITFETVTESTESTVNGQKVPDEEDKSVSTTVIKADGTLVAYKNTTLEEGEKSNARFHIATNPIFEAKAVGVGDKWTVNVKGNDSLSTVDATAEFEVVAFKKVAGVDCVEIKEVYNETSGPHKLSVKELYEIELTSGDIVVQETEIDNWVTSADESPMSIKSLYERIEGSPFARKRLW